MTNNEHILIPQGWTYFAHRTNTERWSTNPFCEKSIITNKIMCVVTENDICQEVKRYGFNHRQVYTHGNGTPFEIRCLICTLPYLTTLSDDLEIKNLMLKKFYFDRNNFGGEYGRRHHSIPKNEELVVLGLSNYDEIYHKSKKIIWTIPKRFIEFYKEELTKNNNYIISLNSKENEEKKLIKKY